MRCLIKLALCGFIALNSCSEKSGLLIFPEIVFHSEIGFAIHPKNIAVKNCSPDVHVSRSIKNVNGFLSGIMSQMPQAA